MNHFAKLSEDHPCHEAFEEGFAPIKGNVARLVELEGLGPCHVFMLDLSRCSEAQRLKVAEASSVIGGNGPVEEILRYMESPDAEIPVRAASVTAVMSQS